MHKSVPHQSSRESAQNQAGSQRAILRMACTFDNSWQRLFQEIVIWRRLSHPNVLPVLGVSPKLFPLCVISEWMVDGNIMDFTSEHPEANRLRLVRLVSISPQSSNLKIPVKLAEAASGLHYLHSLDIIHSSLKPVRVTDRFPAHYLQPCTDKHPHRPQFSSSSR